MMDILCKAVLLCVQVDMNWNSFNQGDVFLLDLGNLIIQWNGAKSNRMERLKVYNYYQHSKLCAIFYIVDLNSITRDNVKSQ